MPGRMSLPLLASIAALFLGPGLYAATRTRASAAALDAFALVGVIGLVLAHVLPQSFELAGWWIVPAALAGLFGPGLLCGTRLLAGSASGRITMPLALFGIALHAMLDGGALAGGDSEDGRPLAVAVVLHRLPVGLAIWWLARPLYGLRAAGILLGSIAVFTVIGFHFGASLLASAPQMPLALVQAVVAGSLLHVVLKHPPHPPAHSAHGTSSARVQHVASGLGGLAGLLMLFAVDHRWHLDTHHVDRAQSLGVFLDLALASAPALLFAYAAVALVHAWAFDLRSFLGRGGALSQALRGTIAGLPIPVCSCGVIPIYRSLIHQRVPTPAAMSFLIATPEVGIAALFLSWPLLGGEITLLRVGCAALLALGVGLLVGRGAPVLERLPAEAEAARGRAGALARVRQGLAYGFGDMVDGTAPWIVVGLAVAALIAPVFDAETFLRLPDALEVPLFALMGLPLYVCASGSTPLAAVLIAKGVSPGAAIAFLLTGPATNITTFGVLGRLHGRARALAFAAVTAACTIALGYAVNGVLPDGSGVIPVAGHEHGARPLESLSLVLLGLLFAASFVRQGTRGFVGQVVTPHGRAGGHDHEHDHGHEDEGTGGGGSCCHAPAAIAAPGPHVTSGAR